MTISAPEQEMARQNAAGHITLRDSLSFQTLQAMQLLAAAQYYPYRHDSAISLPI